MDRIAPPWPRDERARHWADEFEDMDAIIKQLEVPASVPINTARAFDTARELIRFSYYHFEFAAVAVATSIIAIEAALRERYGGGNLASLIRRGLEDGTINAEQADLLNTGRSIRNRYAHGETAHPALPIPFAVRMVSTSLDVIVSLSQPESNGIDRRSPTTGA